VQVRTPLNEHKSYSCIINQNAKCNADPDTYRRDSTSYDAGNKSEFQTNGLLQSRTSVNQLWRAAIKHMEQRIWRCAFAIEKEEPCLTRQYDVAADIIAADWRWLNFFGAELTAKGRFWFRGRNQELTEILRHCIKSILLTACP
jgi:hypothetical protein